MHRPRSGRREKVPAGPPQAHRLVAGGWTADLAGGGDVTCRGPGAANSRGGGGVVGSSGVADFYPCPGRNATSLKALLTWQSEATVPLFVAGVRTTWVKDQRVWGLAWVLELRGGSGTPRPAPGTAAGCTRCVLLGQGHSVRVEPPTVKTDNAAAVRFAGPPMRRFLGHGACQLPPSLRALFKTTGSFCPCK